MSDIDLVIRIPEEVYKAYKRDSALCTLNADQKSIAKSYLINGLINGTVLPKGHGRLKDTDAICKDIISALGIRDENYLLEAEEAIYKRIKNAPTIIEADKEGEA